MCPKHSQQPASCARALRCCASNPLAVCTQRGCRVRRSRSMRPVRTTSRQRAAPGSSCAQAALRLSGATRARCPRTQCGRPPWLQVHQGSGSPLNWAVQQAGNLRARSRRSRRACVRVRRASVRGGGRGSCRFVAGWHCGVKINWNGMEAE